MKRKQLNLFFAVLALSLSGTDMTQAQTIQPTASYSSTSATNTLPAIFPTPVSIELRSGTVSLGKSVLLVASAEVGEETTALLHAILKGAGVETIKTVEKLPKTIDGTYIVLGTRSSASLMSALQRSGATLDDAKSGYTISSFPTENGAIIALAGNDADGLFYAAQSFRQLTIRTTIPGLIIKDKPSSAIRGTIEGFYGKPWTMVEREKHINFLASVKGNTFIYSPKDDPYARDRWREPYPAATLNELGKLAALSRKNHINFVYAISPGPTVCFSSEEDLNLLEGKFKALRAVGIHSFYVALDDIEYTKWNCEQDSLKFGPSGAEAAAVAQSYLLNALQKHLKAVDPSAPALIMVPTEYYDAKETPYKAALRKNLDPEIVRQWTGTDVVPPSISINDARAATKAFGQKTLLWDNYPVNDFKESSGRLLLAPYDRREAGLSEELAGIVSNPMNQEAASRVAVTGVLAFGWNDEQYDADKTWAFAARELAAYDPRTTAALLTFFDIQHLAPTFGTHPWQKQAPVLKAKLDVVRDALAYGDAADRKVAIATLIQDAQDFTNAPDIIRTGTVDSAFSVEAAPWLDAMQLWGRALQLTAAGLEAANNGSASAARYFEHAKKLAADATAIQSIPGATRFEGPILIADGVLDSFVKDAPKLIN